MWPLTTQERQAALFAAFVLIAGISFKLVFHVAPLVRESLRVLDDVRFSPKIDINCASYEELLAVPHIGPSAAARIIHYRQARGRISDPAQLAKILRKKPDAVRSLIGVFKWQ